jgi:hypothetical protein
VLQNTRALHYHARATARPPATSHDAAAARSGRRGADDRYERAFAFDHSALCARLAAW